MKIQIDTIAKSFDKIYYYNAQIYSSNFPLLIDNNYKEVFKERILDNGFKKAFKGNWGAIENTKRLGVIQDLNRSSYNSAISHLRKINPLWMQVQKLLHQDYCWLSMGID